MAAQPADAQDAWDQITRAFSSEVDPVRVKKTRQNKEARAISVPIQSERKWL
jgi:hypothetical protein